MSGAGGLPGWLERVSGSVPVLLVAPHGGRRPALSALDSRLPRKVNDLHTAEVTRDLARTTGASAILNRSLDRNDLDLNRVSDVRERAPWFFELLLAEVRDQIERAGSATLFFIHGWNAIQPSCDVGIGARLDAEGGLVPVRRGVVTIPPAFLGRLLAFAAVCRETGIDVTFGDRYPAAGRENVLQVFTSRFREDVDASVRELSRLGSEGKIAAVQLELATPLRWAGTMRSSFLEHAARLVGGSLEGPADGLHHPGSGGAAPERLALEFHDGPAGIGGFAGIERAHSGRRHARLLLCLGARRLGLFTGEDALPRSAPLSCFGLEWTDLESGGRRLEYRGPCLLFPRTDPFLDLEAGLAAAELSNLEARLDWQPLDLLATPRSSARLGRVRGRVGLAGHPPIAVSAPGVLQVGGAADEASPWRERRALRIPVGEASFLSISSRVYSGDERVEGEIAVERGTEPILSGRVEVRNGPDGRTPAALRVEAVSRSRSWRVFGQVGSAVPVVREGEMGRILTYFGLARFGRGADTGFGTFELSRRLDGAGLPKEGSE